MRPLTLLFLLAACGEPIMQHRIDTPKRIDARQQDDAAARIQTATFALG